MNVRELRRKYLAFFESKGHSEYPSGSLVPIDATGRLDESLLFNGAGMVQFKPFFRGVAEPPNKRLTTAQKCLRTGDIDCVGDLSHLTLFEMMGNFSFGDYFKAEAIAYSWEFLTSKEWLGLDQNRLAFTVFEEDDEAHSLWSSILTAAGIDAGARVFRLDEETNYWPAGAFSSGPPGPCGPNSEMFFWTSNEAPPTAPYTRDDFVRDEAQGKWLEIWNDVFIQYEWLGKLKDPTRPDLGYEKLGMPPLPFQSVDTGMGLDRTAAVLGGFSSVYDTDAFQPVLRKLESLAPGLKYGADKGKDNAMRIIADHLRAACFCIADGILPANNGRGYVLRRLIRRAILKGQRVLGFDELFAYQIVDGVIDAMGDHYRELVDRKEVIVETLKNEESLFRRTLDSGDEMLSGHLEDWKTGVNPKTKQLPGELAFKLYDTYGFPLEVTQELCDEIGVKVDMDGYRAAMAEAQERSRGASGMDTVYGGVGGGLAFLDDKGQEAKLQPTEFLGYEASWADAQVLAVAKTDDTHAAVVLDRTPFYAESGGQMADHGTIKGEGFELKVTHVTKQDDAFIHAGELTGITPKGKVQAVVDQNRRNAIVRNHTATHLLHAALRQTLGKHVTQAGSLVAPDYLRFDFTHGAAMSPEEIAKVEKLVNEQVLTAARVKVYQDVAIDEARDMGAMALFGEKYADKVRVVQIGDMQPDEPAFSRELCGGTHVRNVGEIGLFKILHEASAASGVRRIEAVTGLGAYEWVLEQVDAMKQAAGLLKANPKDLVQAVEKNLDALKEERKKREKLAAQGGGAQTQAESIGSVELAVEKMDGADPKDAQLVADRLVEGKPNRVGLVATISDGKVAFVCKVGDAAKAAGAHAGNIVREAAKITGGGGGGRPDFATAGGKDPNKLDEAIVAAKSVLATQLGL